MRKISGKVPPNFSSLGGGQCEQLLSGPGLSMSHMQRVLDTNQLLKCMSKESGIEQRHSFLKRVTEELLEVVAAV